jgi:putative FmdB family regulatory protein
MPFYEYECSNCKFYTEVMQKITDAPLTKCPSCGKNALKKLVSAPIFRLKGAGWYETDFKGDKESRRNLAGSEAEESSKTESATESSKADTSKAETSKAEASKPSKPEVGTAERSAKAAKSAGGSRSAADTKGSPGKRAGSGRPAKPASRVAASKARPALAARSKAKPAAARKKKARK